MSSNKHQQLLAPLATIPASHIPNPEADWFPPVDILEDSSEYLFRVDLPAVAVGDISVKVEGDALFISGERSRPFENGKQVLRVERPHGHFERRFVLPDDASRIEIESVFHHNLLELHVRKVSDHTRNQDPDDPSTRLKIPSGSMIV